MADNLIDKIKELNSHVSVGKPLLFIAERWTECVSVRNVSTYHRRYKEYYLRFNVLDSSPLSNQLEHFDESIPSSLLRYELLQFRHGATGGTFGRWLVCNDGRCGLPQLSRETISRAVRAYQIYHRLISNHNMLTCTHDSHGNVRLEYLGIVSRHSPGKIIHQSTFVMKGVEYNEGDLFECSCSTCRLYRYHLERAFYGSRDNEYTVYEEGLGIDGFNI